MIKKRLAIGLMSGTSLDGIDVALLETDGMDAVRPLGFACYPYAPEVRAQLRACLGVREGTANPAVREAERVLTELHAQAVETFLKAQGLDAAQIDLIGFHGQTIWHNPKAGETVQIGDGDLLARLTGLMVVNDFRSADVKAGGQGAPLVPLYHRALAASLRKPLAIVNIGGVSNVTWIGGAGDDDVVACDLGPGNALLDDWMLQKTGQPFDKDGVTAAKGHPDPAHLRAFLAHPYFVKRPPKSLDRDAFSGFMPTGMSVEDGAATLTAMTVRAIAFGLGQMPSAPWVINVAGGGRHNKTMMGDLARATGAEVHSVDDLGWDGDAIEAQAFAYLAVRSVLGLPLSLPTTTGVLTPMTGGKVHG